MRVAVLLLLCFNLACHHRRQTGGLDNTDQPQSGQPQLPAVYITPKGESIVPGTVDEQGYVVPLDVFRPRAPRPAKPQPQLRTEVQAANFAETRLGPDDGHTKNETSIGVDGETLVAGWNQATGSTIVMGVGHSSDGGETWTNQTFGGFTTMSDPIVAAAGNGRWYYAFIASGGSAGGDYEVFVRRSDDDGLTWQPGVAVTQNSTFDDKPNMVAQGDDVLVAWADFSFSPARIRAAVSHNGGTSFTHSTVLVQNSGGGNGASPVIASDGSYYVFWRDSMQQFIWMAKSVDGGMTWSTDSTISSLSPLPSSLPPGFRIVNLPMAAADPISNDLVVVWNDANSGNGDIVAVHSSDGGAHWSGKVRVNDDVGSTHQFFPAVTIDATQRTHVVWYDMRGNGADIDVYTSTSEDHGASFTPNTRITAAAFTPVLPHEGGLAAFIGDYNGIASDGARTYPFYQDARRGVQEVYVAVVPQEGDPPSYEKLLALWPSGVTILDILTVLP